MKTCALVGASTFNAEQFELLQSTTEIDEVIAVDGGLSSLESIGVNPDLAIGDFDSLGYIPRGMRVSRFPVEKDASDMELALKRVHSKHFDRVYIFGALGKRLDHTLANMQLFAKYCELGMEIVVIDESNAVFFITGPDAFEAPARSSGTVSVFAMNDECSGVFERGLKWELDNVILTNRTSLGLSNELIGEAVLIGVESGTIAIFFPL